MHKIRILTCFLIAILCHYGVVNGIDESYPQIKIPSHEGYWVISCHSVEKDSVEEDESLHLGETPPSLVYLTVKEVRDEGLLLVMDDGSEWDIKYFSGSWRILGWGWTEQENVSHWSVGDAIEIQYRGGGNLIDFVLHICNLTRKEEVCAMLKRPPSVHERPCLWVVDIDQETNIMTVSNGSVWFKTNADMHGALLQQKPHSQATWQQGDILTLVRVEGWLNDSFLLWNHSMNEMPYANRIN